MGAVIAMVDRVCICEPHSPIVCSTLPLLLYFIRAVSVSVTFTVFPPFPLHHAQRLNSSPRNYFPLLSRLNVLHFVFQTRSHESAKKASLRIRFVIVGGGAAGLSCAVALRRVGHEVIILEKGPNFIGVRTAPVPPAMSFAHTMYHAAKQVPRNPYATQHDKSLQLLGHA